MPTNGTMRKRKWRVVNDANVRHIWVDDHHKEHAIYPGFYEDSGTPIDELSGEDMLYDRTEILS